MTKEGSWGCKIGLQWHVRGGKEGWEGVQEGLEGLTFQGIPDPLGALAYSENSISKPQRLSTVPAFREDLPPPRP